MTVNTEIVQNNDALNQLRKKMKKLSSKVVHNE